jgi:O-antigen/teichoic acid export membrane protein
VTSDWLRGLLARRGASAEARRLLAASLGSVSATLAVQLCLLVSGPLVARMLGVDGRGYLAGLTLWPLVISLLGGLGVPVGCTYFLSQRPADRRRILGEVYRIALVQAAVLTAIAALVLFAWSSGRPPEVRIAAYPLLVLLPAMLAHQYAMGVLQGQHRFRAFNVLRLLPPALYAAAVAALFVTGHRGLVAVAVVSVVAFALPAAMSTALALARERPDWRRIPGFRRELLAFSLRGHLGAVSPVDSLRVDQAAVALFLSPATMGLYVVAYAFTNLPRFLADAAGKVAYPAVVRHAGTARGTRLVWRFFWAVTLVNVPLAIFLVAVMPWLVRLFFGAEFAGAVPIARVLLVGTTAVASRRILVEGLRGLGRPAVSTVSEVAMYPWLLAAAPVGIARWGATGLAGVLAVGYALSLAVALVSTLEWHGSRRVRPFEARPEVASPCP